MSAELIDKVEEARVKVLEHKAAIRLHRGQLAVAAENLKKLEAECARRGIGLVRYNAPGVGEGPHGRNDPARS